MTRNRLYLLVIVLCLAGYTLIGFNYKKYTDFSVNNEPLIEVCIFKNLTGVPCPSCGTTRSVTAMAHGYVKEALIWNPLGIIMSIAMIIFPLWIGKDLITGSDSFFRFYRRVEIFFQKKPVAIIAILIVVINWIWNIHKYL